MGKDPTHGTRTMEDRARRTRQGILVAAALFMLLVAGVVGYGTWQSYHLVMTRAREVTMGFALTYRAFTEQTLENLSGALREIAAFREGLRPVTAPPDLGAYLRLRRDQLPLARDLLIADADGTVELWTGVWPPSEIVRDPRYLAHRARPGAGDRDWLSPVYRDPLADGRFTFALAHTLRDADGRPIGSVIALIDQAAFAAAYDTLLDSEQASVALVHLDGTVMARLPDPGGVVGEVIPSVAARPVPGPARRIQLIPSPIDDRVRIIAEWRLSGYPLIAAATITRDAVLAPWRQDVAWGLGVLLLAGLGITVLTFGLMRQVRLQARAQEALQRQYTVLMAQQQTSTDGILVVDRNGRVLSWNSRFADLWGFTDQDMRRGDSARLRTLARERVADPDGFDRRVAELYANLDIDELEGTEIRFRDGRVLERYSRALRGEDGAAWGRVWFFRDVTQQRHDEQALRESEQRFRDVANAADEYIWEVDAAGKLTFMTERAQDILGYPVGAMLGRSPMEFIAAEDAPWVQALFADAQARRGKLEIAEFRSVRSDGSTVWQRTCAVPMIDDAGALAGYRGTSMSIDDIKARELEAQEASARLEDQAVALVGLAEQLDTSNREMRRVQERFDLAMRGTTDGIYDWDLLTNRIYLSPRWREMLGLGDNEAEVSPAYWTRRIHIDDYIDSVRALSAHLWAKTPQYRHVHRIRHHDGHYLWVLDRAQVVRDVEGQAVRLVGTHADVTEMRRYEDALRQAKTEAEAANAAKSRFLAVMSHEIRTPMTGVLGMADLLLSSDLSRRQRSYAETLKRSADTLLGLLNDILDFSKVEAGQLVLDDIDFEIGTVMEDVAQLFCVNASEKGLSMETVQAVEPPPALRGDPHRLRQILFNLVGNAIKFTEKGGVAIVLEACVPQADGGYLLTLAVRDTGIGLSPDQRQRLFQPFIQADNTTTRRFGGTGLGLAICKRLVEAMRGTISVQSAQGEGSTFRFTIRCGLGDPAALPPAGGGPAAGLPAPSDHRRPAPGTRLLLAEDTTANRLLIATVLERLGYTVDEAQDGAEALAAVRAEPEAYALVLMDMQMPIMDGVEATRAILALPGDPPPVIGLTADAMRENHAVYREAGLLEVLTKPVDWAALEAAVATHARGVRWLEAEATPETEPEPEPAGEPGPEAETEPKAETEPAAAPAPARPDPEPAQAPPPRGEPAAPPPPPGPVPAALVERTDEAVAAGLRPTDAEAAHTLAGDAPLFEPAALDALRTRLGTARIAPIVRSMLTNMETQLDNLREAAHHGDAESVARAGHSLKGLAGQFGATRLSRAGQTLQHGSLDPATVGALLPGLEAMAAETRTAIVAWLERYLEPSA